MSALLVVSHPADLSFPSIPFHLHLHLHLHHHHQQKRYPSSLYPEGRPAQIMCAYNALNGIPSCLHDDLINGLARERWGFDGLVVSDQDSILTAFEDLKYKPTQAEVRTEPLDNRL